MSVSRARSHLGSLVTGKPVSLDTPVAHLAAVGGPLCRTDDWDRVEEDGCRSTVDSYTQYIVKVISK